MAPLTIELVNRALQHVTPRITQVMSQADGNRSHLHVVVMETRKPLYSGRRQPDRFVAEFSFGDKSTWSYRYDVWARNIAERTTHAGTLPEFTLFGECGLAITADFVVACASALPYLDTEFALLIARAISGETEQEHSESWPTGRDVTAVEDTVAYS